MTDLRRVRDVVNCCKKTSGADDEGKVSGGERGVLVILGIKHYADETKCQVLFTISAHSQRVLKVEFNRRWRSLG